MKMLALLLFVMSMLWYMTGGVALAWMLPVVQQEYWYNVGAGSGFYDFAAGVVNGISIAVLLRRSSHHHDRHYLGW